MKYCCIYIGKCCFIPLPASLVKNMPTFFLASLLNEIHCNMQLATYMGDLKTPSLKRLHKAISIFGLLLGFSLLCYDGAMVLVYRIRLWGPRPVHSLVDYIHLHGIRVSS